MTAEVATSRLRGVAAALLIFPAPFVLQWLLLMLGGHDQSNGFVGLLAFVLPLSIAGAGFVLLPASGRTKTLLAVLLVPPLFLAVAWFQFSYVCSAYGDCL